MVFRSEKQRKGFFASRGNTRSNVRPNISIRERLRKRFRPTQEELAKQRGARLKREAEELEQAKIRTQQLELEAGVERRREDVARRERQARQSLREIDIARRERRLAPIREAGRRVAVAGRVVGAGLAKAERATRPKKRRRAKRQEAETGFFGI